MSISRRRFLKVLGMAAAAPMTFACFSKTEAKKLAEAEVKRDFDGGYKRVIFSGKRDEYEPDEVTLGVNGNWLVVKRETPVVMPDMYLECCDHSMSPQLSNNRQIEYVKNYPYTVLGPATKDDYNQ